MEAVGFALLGLLALVVMGAALALTLPLRVWLAFDTAAERKLSVRLQPFGRFGPRFPVTGGTDRPKRAKRPKKPRRHRARRWRAPGGVGWPDLRRAVSGIVAAIHFEEIRVDARFGTGDPAETGHIFGLLAPLVYGGGGCPRAHLNLRPVFDSACLAGAGHLQWRVRPVAVLWPLLWLGFAALRGPQ